MARALSVNLPETLSADNVETLITAKVDEVLKKQGYRLGSLPEKVTANIIPVAIHQAQKVVKNKGILWQADNQNDTAFVTMGNLGLDEDRLIDEEYLSDADATQIRESAVKAITTAVEEASFFVAGGVISVVGTNR